jgi:hypothetical protein
MVFTEHGAIMAATVLKSPKAIEMSVYVVRAFVRLRQLVQANADLARKLAALERSVARLDTSTRTQFDDVYAAIKALMAQPPGKQRPIGFTVDLEELSVALAQHADCGDDVGVTCSSVHFARRESSF